MKSSKFTYTDADEFIITPPEEDRAQPRMPDGKFGSSSSGESEDDDDAYMKEMDRIMGSAQDGEPLSQKRADEIASKINDKTDTLTEKESAELISLEDSYQKDMALSSLSDLEDSLSVTDDRGFNMTEKAIKSTDTQSRTNLLIDADGNIAGAVNYTRKPAYDLGDGEFPGKVIEMKYLGTTGIVDGAGSSLFGQVLRYASSRDSGIMLTPLDTDAFSFWKKMGFSPDTIMGQMYMTKDDVKLVASQIMPLNPQS